LGRDGCVNQQQAHEKQSHTSRLRECVQHVTWTACWPVLPPRYELNHPVKK
jgi:hypothetical protein